ncbi:MAG: hypothetical protein KDD62_10040 [Bdellovibrionales bacterium]|nr:hypothetical protein [Bdellovibrionales bacterium]
MVDPALSSMPSPDWHTHLKLSSDHSLAFMLPVDINAVPLHPELLLVNRTLRFSLPIPDWGLEGEPLVYPAVDTARAGNPIKLGDDGQPARGLVFLNRKDGGIYQGVVADGTKVLIFNDITRDIAKRLQAKILSVNPYIDQLSISDMKKIVAFAAHELKVVDMYNGRASSIIEDTKPVDGFEVPLVGGKVRDDFGYRVVSRDDPHQVGLIGIQIIGDRHKSYLSDAVVLSDGQHRWCIARDVVERNFRKLVLTAEDNLFDERPLRSLRLEFGLDA